MSNSFYGDNVRWFTGVVTKTGDEYGRVQVFIHGIHSVDSKAEDLPWASVVSPSTEGGISGFGRNTYLQGGALVFGFFLDGDKSQNPMVIGSLTKTEIPTFGQVEEATTRGNTSYGSPNSTSKNGTVIPAYAADVVASGERVNRIFIAMDTLVTNGLPVGSAAGVVGNLIGENYNLDPELQSQVPTSQITDPTLPTQTVTQNVGKEPAWGIAQWNASRNVRRWQTLEKIVMGPNWPFTGVRDVNPERKNPLNFITQLEYLIYDMKKSPGIGADGKIRENGYHACWEHLRGDYIDLNYKPDYNSKKSEEINPTHHFLHVFEMGRGRQYYDQADIDKRQKFAFEAFKIYNDSISQSAKI